MSVKKYSLDNVFEIMDITQTNYENMVKRLLIKKAFSNFTITYYSVALITYSLTAEFFPKMFNTKLSSYFNIILSIVVLTYSLIIANANYSERINSTENALNDVKSMKRELTEENVNQKRKEYETIVSMTEYSSDIDFFRTLKQKCKKYNIHFWNYKPGIEKLGLINENVARKMNSYLSKNSPLKQQLIIIFQYLWGGVIIITPILLFIICFFA